MLLMTALVTSIKNKQRAFIITCEHGGNEIPPLYRTAFKDAKAVLKTHRGWDPGALECAEILSKKLNAPLFHSKISRLLIELNRSVGHPKHFSEWSNILSHQAKEQLLADYYFPYRNGVETAIKRLLNLNKQVVHLSIHSFTPVLYGKTRKADVGILFDPGRDTEAHYSNQLKQQLEKTFPEYCIYKNSPYKGTSDGFTTYLRTIYSPTKYLGIEIEINQKFPLGIKSKWNRFLKDLTEGMAAL